MTRSERAAVLAWRGHLGREHVVVEARDIGFAEVATFPTTQRVVAIIRPGCVADIQDSLKVANKFGVPLHPISAGTNWGFGSRVPARDRCALLDLRRMRGIVAFDERLACITVEPGVTFRQLNAFLDRRRSKLARVFVGHSLDASLVGHAVERGWSGVGPYTDRFASVSGLQVVLPSGELVETGGFVPSLTGALHRWGLGPSLDGLFSQSSFGVVTRMSLWLYPEPAVSDAVEFELADDAALGAAIDAIRRLRLEGVLRESLVLRNQCAVLARVGIHAWAERTPKGPLRREELDSIGGPRWRGSGALGYASNDQRNTVRRLLRAAIRPTAERLGFNAIRWPRRLTAAPNQGVAYWGKQTRVAERTNPDADRCGVLFCSPVVPLEGIHVRRVVRIAERELRRHGFDAPIGIAVLSDRTALVNTYLLYDRDTPGADERATQCFAALLAGFGKHGYYPYRMASQLAHTLPRRHRATVAFLAGLKRAVDPKGILAPGRYEF